MNVRSLILGSALSLMGVTAFATAPEGYYSQCEGKKQRALKSQLYSIIKSHKSIPYGTGNGATWTAFRHTDVDESDNTWYDIYTSNRVRVQGTSGAASGMNIEHTFPKSWWGGAKNAAYTDIGHLMPSNSNANSTRNNHPYGEVSSPRANKVQNATYKYGSPVSGQGGGASIVFEPADEYKGDLARNYFYMVTCYQNLSWSAEGLRTAAQGDYPTLQPWAIEFLLKWHRQDPVSDKERKRNDGLWSQQQNRNPFIDHPELAEHIWGNLQDKAWHQGEDPEDPDNPTPPEDPDDPAVLTSPADGDFYPAGDVRPGEIATITVPVLGARFKHAVVARIEGLDANCFDIAAGGSLLKALSITQADVNSEEGYYLTVRYAPVSVTPGNSCHTATLTLSGKDLDAPVTIYVQGTCTEEVELAAPVALEAEDVADEGYTARWLKSTDEIDGYTLYRDIYTEDGSAVDRTLEYDVDPDADSFAVTDRDPNLKETYRLVATKGSSVSPESNVIIVEATNCVGDIFTETDGTETYYTTDGVRLPGKPSDCGIYIVKKGSRVQRTVRF